MLRNYVCIEMDMMLSQVCVLPLTSRVTPSVSQCVVLSAGKAEQDSGWRKSSFDLLSGIPTL